MKNGLTESLVINVTATVSPVGTGARAPPLPAAALPDAPPLAALLAAALLAAADVVVVALLLLPHADNTSAAAVVARNRGTNRPVRDLFAPYRMVLQLLC
jgi:hypothetical protein